MRLVGFLGQVRRLRICNGQGRGPSSAGSSDVSGGLCDEAAPPRRVRNIQLLPQDPAFWERKRQFIVIHNVHCECTLKKKPFYDQTC